VSLAGEMKREMDGIFVRDKRRPGDCGALCQSASKALKRSNSSTAKICFRSIDNNSHFSVLEKQDEKKQFNIFWGLSESKREITNTTEIKLANLSSCKLHNHF